MATFSPTALPAWLRVPGKIDPLSYAVALLRQAVFNQRHPPQALRLSLDPGIRWGNQHLLCGLCWPRSRPSSGRSPRPTGLGRAI